jgi:hypothetical protein
MQSNEAQDVGTPGDLIFGARAIAKETGLTARAVYHRIRYGDLPGAFHTGATLTLSRSAYRTALAQCIRAEARAA